MTTIRSNVALYSWQKDTIKGIINYPHDIHVVKAPRQRGKSVTLEQLILYVALNNARTKSFFISPSFPQAEKVYTELLNAVKNSSVFAKAKGDLFQIHFVNGSVIQFLSASQSIESLQGYTASGILIIDESAFISDEVHYAVFPYADANKVPIVMVSTPRFKQGIFYDMFTDDTTHSYDWCSYDTSALLSKERLEQYRKKLPKIKFIQQYLGQFTDANSGVFGEFSSVLDSKMLKTEEMEIVFGIDWATGSGGDETAIAIFDRKTKRMINIVHFNDKNANETIDIILELARQYVPVKIAVESNSIGKVFSDVLKSKIQKLPFHCTVILFNTTNESKSRIVDAVVVAIQNKEIVIVDEDTLVLQMTNFISKLTATGKVTYCNSKNEIHDDCVMALCIGFWCCTNGGNYAIRIGR